MPKACLIPKSFLSTSSLLNIFAFDSDHSYCCGAVPILILRIQYQMIGFAQSALNQTEVEIRLSCVEENVDMVFQVNTSGWLLVIFHSHGINIICKVSFFSHLKSFVFRSGFLCCAAFLLIRLFLRFNMLFVLPHVTRSFSTRNEQII